jgi:hypothetical protein
LWNGKFYLFVAFYRIYQNVESIIAAFVCVGIANIALNFSIVGDIRMSVIASIYLTMECVSGAEELERASICYDATVRL